jgi:hypothetical protein
MGLVEINAGIGHEVFLPFPLRLGDATGAAKAQDNEGHEEVEGGTAHA